MSPPQKKKAKLSKKLAKEIEEPCEKSRNMSMNEWKSLSLSEETIKALECMGFEKPTPIQSAVIPLALNNQVDIVGAAETGSGKTLAFAIPIFERWMKAVKNANGDEEKINSLFALVLTPTRELAIQIHKELKRLSTYALNPPLRSIALVGGLSQQKQERLLKSKPQVIVATPGRLWALIQMAEEHLEDMSSLRVLVIDEIDRMLEQGHFQELHNIVERVHGYGEDDSEEISKQLQTFIFSATLTFTHIPTQRLDGSKTGGVTPALKIRKLVEALHMKKDRRIIDLSQATRTPQTLAEYRMNCSGLEQKDSNLYYILNRHRGRTLVFANSIDATRRLYGILKKLQLEPPPMMLHAKMQEQKRLKNFDKFAGLENSVLLATDVAARGLDIQNIDNVVHYQVPRTTESYVHRSGRTARASRNGRSILLVDPTDMQLYQRICKNLKRNKDLDLLEVDSPKLMQACQQRMHLAVECESTEFRMKKSSSRNEWFKRAAIEADIILDDDIIDHDSDDDNPAIVEVKRKKKKLEKSLNKALQVPLPSPVHK
ncbi:DEAD/DEAH box helicase domain-containing protein [Ditylenchus destructor]|nr:DEAD/DEAH box helicase domain-containing protein [Ditylenchus destructor]